MMEQACTSILVGKNASIDGSVMIARNDDTFLPITPQKFIMQAAYQNEDRIWESNLNGFKMTLPKNGYKTSFTPNVDVKHNGVFGETSINEKNVAMSATESVYGNERALAYDPWVENGIAEDSIQNIVAPYIDSARDGVRYLGELIEKYGSPEGNGVLFADKDEAWYMEIVTGHHYAATRIPDDAYVIAANQVAQQEINFDDPNNFMWSNGLQEFVAKHHLNPDKNSFNFRKIFGTDTKKDRHYNTPRVWFGQQYFTPEVKQEPTSSELPFICRANRLLSVEDLQYVLSSHYNETKYDPLGNGTEEEKKLFRPISLNRTQNSHVLQLRNTVSPKHSALMWMCFGVPSFTPYVPFYANADDIAASWSDTPLEFDMNSDYWMYRALSMLVESHHAQFIQDDIDYLKDCRQLQRTMIEVVDNQVAALDGKKLTAALTNANDEMVKVMRDKAMKMIDHYFVEGLKLSKLTFNMDANL